MLQSAKIDLSKALYIITNLVETFFESIWEEAKLLSNKCCIYKAVQRKIPRSIAHN